MRFPGRLGHALHSLDAARIAATLRSLCSASARAAMDDDTIVQYIVVRKDLKWPAGALIAQGAHGALRKLEAGRLLGRQPQGGLLTRRCRARRPAAHRPRPLQPRARPSG